MKLFIIGNGFDLYHKMETKYSNFKKYLCQKYDVDENIEFAGYELPNYNNDFEDYILDEEVVSHVVSILNNANYENINWGDFEANLSKIDLGEYHWNESVNVYDKEGDINPFHTSNNMEQLCDDSFNIINYIKNLFCEWILDVKLGLQVQKVVDAIDSKDNFLTFNYTKILEVVYGISDEHIFHIHGTKKNDIIVGHGERIINDEFGDFSPARLNIISQNNTRKDSEEIYSKNKMKLLNLFKSTNIIYSFGFSYSEVDMYYFEQVFKVINTRDYCWYFRDYSESENKRYETALLGVGYKGKFSRFKI